MGQRQSLYCVQMKKEELVEQAEVQMGSNEVGGGIANGPKKAMGNKL